jgi:3-oxoadipate enol-lactonase
MKFALVNGLTLHYRQDGRSDGIPLVFINSLGCDLRIWDGVVSRLSHPFALIRFDQRGHGLSDAPPTPYSMRQLAEDVNGLLDHLGIERAILVGVSVGGLVALQTALDFPGRVAALVLCDTAARIGTEAYWNDRITALREHGMAFLADTILARWFTPEFIQQNPALYRGFYNLLTRMPLDGYIGTCLALRDTDLRDRLGEVHVPALVPCGTQDVVITPEIARGLADSLPNARLRLIENAAHTPSVEQPEALAAAIIEFLKENVYVE